jgi:general secretion pathway protein G
MQKTMIQRLRERSEVESGFTLIELLIVIVILGILAAIVVFAVGTTGKTASTAACQSDVKTVETALEASKAQSAGGATYDATIAKLVSDGYLREAPPSTGVYTVDTDGTGGVVVAGTGVVGGTLKADGSGTTAIAACTAK